MVLVKTWSTWVDDNGDAQPGKLSPNQTEELSSDDRLFGKTQRRPDQRIGICRRSLLNQPLRHRSRSQIRTGERNDVPTLAETIQHVPLLFFRVTQKKRSGTCWIVSARVGTSLRSPVRI